MQLRSFSCLSLVALLLACTPGGSDTTTTSNDESTSSDEDSSSDPDPSDPDPTTSGGTTTTAGTTTGTPGTTTDATTGETTDPSTTTGGGEACLGTAECGDGYCWFDYVMSTPTMDDFTCHDVCVDDAGGGNSEQAWCFDNGACCNPDAECDMMGYCVPGGGETTTGETEGTTGETEGTSGETTDGETTEGTGGVTPLLSISDLVITANCQPMVPMDPVKAMWSLDVDNTMGDAEVTATVSKSSLTYTPGMGEFIQQIKVVPAMIGPVAAMEMASTPMSKMSAINNLPEDCSRCDDTVRLDLTFTVDGMDVPVSAEAMLECVF